MTRSSDPMKLSFRDDLRAVPKDFISNPSTLSPPSKQLPFGEGSRHTHFRAEATSNSRKPGEKKTTTYLPLVARGKLLVTQRAPENLLENIAPV